MDIRDTRLSRRQRALRGRGTSDAGVPLSGRVSIGLADSACGTYPDHRLERKSAFKTSGLSSLFDDLGLFPPLHRVHTKGNHIHIRWSAVGCDTTIRNI